MHANVLDSVVSLRKTVEDLSSKTDRSVSKLSICHIVNGAPKYVDGVTGPG